MQPQEDDQNIHVFVVEKRRRNGRTETTGMAAFTLAQAEQWAAEAWCTPGETLVSVTHDHGCVCLGKEN